MLNWVYDAFKALYRSFEWHYRSTRDAINTLLTYRPILVEIVRKYTDANGAYIGEMYVCHSANETEFIGVTLDTFPLACKRLTGVYPDLYNDFLVPIPDDVFRVGAMHPEDYAKTVRRAKAFNWKNAHIVISNRFIEEILAGRKRSVHVPRS